MEVGGGWTGADLMDSVAGVTIEAIGMSLQIDQFGGFLISSPAIRHHAIEAKNSKTG